MISNPFFLLSVLLSSLLAFLGAALTVEVVMRIFRVRRYRVRSMLRLIPFFVLVVDLLFDQYSIAYWINPLSCASCIQKFFLEMFFPELRALLIQNKTSLITHLGLKYQHSFFAALFGFFGVVSLVSVASKLTRAFALMYVLRGAQKRSLLSERQVESTKLKQTLQKNRMRIYESDETQTPLTIYPNTIIVPRKATDTLSQREYEAVIAHECEHIKYRDPLTRLLYHFIAAFFWWVPTRFWIKKVEQEQELACDQSVLKYGISGDSIASALLKVARLVKVHQTICCFTSSGSSTVLRIQDALGLEAKHQNSIRWIAFSGVFLGGGFVLICMMYL